MRWSIPIPSATVRKSTPTVSQSFVISLTNEILVARIAFDAYLIIAAVSRSVFRIGASIPA